MQTEEPSTERLEFRRLGGRIGRGLRNINKLTMRKRRWPASLLDETARIHIHFEYLGHKTRCAWENVPLEDLYKVSDEIDSFLRLGFSRVEGDSLLQSEFLRRMGAIDEVVSGVQELLSA